MPKQFIKVGDQQLELPKGVSVHDWGLEKVTTQNPRIRAFLGCIRLLGEVLESNYAILHCSPERLIEVWHKVRRVAELTRTKIGPLLHVPSIIPTLEEARQHAEEAFKMLNSTVLKDLEQFPENVAPHRLMELRKLLCVSIGQLHSFLQDTFSQLAASDPRSGFHDADYFLSRRFSQDIDEAEWLHATVARLYKHLVHLEKILPFELMALAKQLRKDKTIPHHHTWEEVKTFLDLLLNSLTPKLREVLALRGIRFSEMEVIDRYSTEIPTRCRLLIEIHDMGSQAIEEIQGNVGTSSQELEQCGLDLKTSHAVISRRMASHLVELDRMLQDLIAFVPIWLQGIELRRALMLKRTMGDETGATEPSSGDQASDVVAVEEANPS